MKKTLLLAVLLALFVAPSALAKAGAVPPPTLAYAAVLRRRLRPLHPPAAAASAATATSTPPPPLRRRLHLRLRLRPRRHHPRHRHRLTSR